MRCALFIALMLLTACSLEAMPIVPDEQVEQPQKTSEDNGPDNAGNTDPGNATTKTKGTVVKDIVIKSTILEREMQYSVYLPAGYTEEKKYPVIYLLRLLRRSILL